MELNDGVLTISAAKGLDKDEEDKKGNYIRKERYAGEMLCVRKKISPVHGQYSRRLHRTGVLI